MRVMMLETDRFARDWADAAAGIAHVVTVRPVDHLSWPNITKHVSRHPRDPNRYQLQRLHLRPTRYLGGMAAAVTGRRLDQALQIIDADHGPVDIAHTHFYSNTRPLLHVKYPLRHIHTEHSTRLTLRSAAHKPLSSQGLAIAREAYRGADCVIAVSQYLADCIQRLGLDLNLEIIGNPVSVDLFVPRASDPHRLVSVGRLEADKRLDALLYSFASVRASRHELSLEIIGDGPDRASLSGLSERLGLGGAVVFSGHLPREEVAKRVGTARLYVNSSQVETFGIAVAEALSAGVPVVAPRYGPLPELVGDHAGVLVPSLDELHSGIEAALQRTFDPVAIRESVTRRFSPSSVGNQLRGIYSRSLKQHS